MEKQTAEVKHLNNFIKGKILELRTTADGDYDYSINCWAAREFILVTDQCIYRFTANYNPNDARTRSWMITKMSEFSKDAYPFRLKTFTQNPLAIVDYEELNGMISSMTLQYEDALLWISPQIEGFSLIALRIYLWHDDEDVIKKLSQEPALRSKYLRWEESVQYYVIEFENGVKEFLHECICR